MKKIFLILSIIALSVSCTSKYEDDVVELGNRIDKLEQKIPTIEQQISAIDESITLLKQTDEALRAKDEQLATEDEKLNMAIQELEILITDLEKYVIYPGLNSTKDWAEATFYTLKQYNAAVSTLAKLEQSIASSDDATSKEISDAISALQASFQTWVGKELSGYYSIARADAEFAALRQSIESGDQTLQGEIDDVESQIANSATELEKEYQAAIETAIEEYNGTITAELKSQLDDVNKHIDEQVAAINDKLDALEAQIGKNSKDIAKLLTRIQSLSYVHKYADGKAKMVCTSDYYSSRMSFEVSPKDAVAELEKVWKDIVSAKALGQGVGEEQFVSLPVQLVEADAQSGIITLQLSDTKLPAPIAAASEEIQVAVQISDGNTAIVSDYIPVVKSKIEGDVLIYTTKDGNIFEPIADAFDANIVSNTYDEGIGIIVFDAPITTIGFSAFKGCSSLTSVTIGKGVTSIRGDAFSGCSSLTSFYGKFASGDNRCLIVDGVLNFFAPANLTSYTIPDSVTSIGGDAFNGCSSLTSVTIPDSVTSIGGSAFYGCSSLTSVTIPDSVTSIGGDAFKGCSGELIINSKIVETDYTSNNYPMYYLYDGWLCGSKFTKLTIGDSVTKIGKYAFKGCSSLTSVTIGKGVTSIGGDAFEGCTGELIINSKIVETDYTSDDYPSKYYGWLYGSKFTKLTIGDSVTKIGKRVFSGCSSLTSVTIPNSVTTIGSYAFSGCTGELIINSKIVETNYSSSSNYDGWHEGSNFTKLTIGDSVTKIGNYAFYGCSSLTSVTIPDSVTSIGESAFSGCSSLKSVNITDLSAWCKIVFGDVSANPLGYAKKLYLDGMEVTKITIPSDITKIKPYTFYGCCSLKNVTIHNRVTSIGSYAFSGCSSLTSVTIPNSVTSIGGSAFYGCGSLTSVTIPNSVTSIGKRVFYGCSGELIINSKIVETDYTSNNYPMYNHYDGWLEGSNFTKLTIGDSVTKIGNYAFSGCSSLTSITIPDSVTSIGRNAFHYCRNLTSVTIPDNVTKIGGSAFSSCYSLTSVYCKPTTPPAGGDYMFSSNGSVRNIYVPRNSLSKYESAKYWCDYIDYIVGYDF